MPVTAVISDLIPWPDLPTPDEVVVALRSWAAGKRRLPDDAFSRVVDVTDATVARFREAGPSQTKVTLTYDWSEVGPEVRSYPQVPPLPRSHLENSLRHLAVVSTRP